MEPTRPAPIARFDPFLVLFALFCGALLGGLGIARYEGYNAGMLDLGNMAQAIWSATQGEPLHVTFPEGIVSRLGLHVELIYFLFAPFYALWPDPRLLLIIQAALFVLGALPVYWMACRRTESRFAARCLALIYLFYPTAQTSVLFDFHGDTLAMPLLLFFLDALDRRAWRSSIIVLVLALSCKTYVAVPVVGIGLYVLLWGGIGSASANKRLGGLIVAAGVWHGVATFFIVRSLFATGGTAASTSPVSYLAFYFGQVGELWLTLGDRLLSAAVVFGPALLVARHGWRWLLVGLPLALAMLLSTGPGGSYDFRYHHYAMVVPFVMMAAIEGTARLANAPRAPRRRRPWRADLLLSLVSVLLFSLLLVDTPLNPLFWAGLPGQGRDPSAYGVTSRDEVKDRFLARAVPPREPLAASAFLAPHLANRRTLYLVRYSDDPGSKRLPAILPRVDYVLADALFDYFIPLGGDSYGGGVDYEREAIALTLRDPAFGLVAACDGLLLFERGASTTPRALTQTVDVSEHPTESLSPQPGNAPLLLDSNVVPQGERRFRVTFAWGAPASPMGDYVAVSTLEHETTIKGQKGQQKYTPRIVHLPTYALLPTTQWQPGHVARETFDVELPPEVAAGRYTWRVGWYGVRTPYAYATDERSLLPGSTQVVGTIDVE